MPANEMRPTNPTPLLHAFMGWPRYLPLPPLSNVKMRYSTPMVGRKGAAAEDVPSGASRSRAGERGGRGAPRVLSRPGVVWAATAGLWLLVVAGVLLGAVSLAADAAPDPHQRTVIAASSSGAEGFAELYVSAFLQAGEGTEEELRPFYPGDLDLSGVVPRSLYVVRAVSLGARPVGPGYWAVTVGTELLASAEGGYVAAGHHYFTVGVLETSGGHVATSLPAEVPGPAPQEPPKLAVETLDHPPDDAVTRAVARFLDAYLAGQGELARYVAPGSGLRPIAPPPYSDSELVAASYPPSNAGRLARVRVRAVDGGGRVAVLEYSLEVAERDGRWEVTRLLEAPPLQVP